MSETDCSICHIVDERDANLLLAETPFWQVYLSDQQNYPGRCFIPSKRHVARAGDLTNEEWTDLQRVLDAVETTVCEKLGASHVNFSCLMNGAYGDERPHPHVHLHAIPRYPEPVEFGGMEFTDDRYGFHYTTDYDWILSREGACEVKALIGNGIAAQLGKS